MNDEIPNDEGIPKHEIPRECSDLRRKVVDPHFGYLSSLLLSLGISSFVISLTSSPLSRRGYLGPAL